jgi:uncharacterized protein YjbJ (UPF0337 family)
LDGGKVDEPFDTWRNCGPRAAFPQSDQKGKNMDKDRIKGMGDQAKGAVKDATGKVLGDSKLQAEGKADKAKGRIENAVGGAKDAVRDAINK